MQVRVDLDSIPLLSGIDSEARAFLEKKLRLTRYAKNSFVMIDGEQSYDLLFLLKGRLNIVSETGDGRWTPLALLKPGSHFGEISVIDSQPRSATVVAAQESLVGLLKQKDALALFAMSPLVASRVMQRMAQLIRKNNQIRHVFSIASTPKRFYNYLLNELVEQTDGKGVVQDVPKQNEIAQFLNISRESVSRALNQLVKAGVVKKEPGKIVVLSTKELAKWAELD